MKKYKNYIIIGVMLTLIALIFLFWDDIKKMFGKKEVIEEQSSTNTNTGNKPKPSGGNNNNAFPTEQKFGIWAKLNFGVTGVPVLAEYNKQVITEIENGKFIGDFL